MSFFKPRLKGLVEYCSIQNQIYFFHQPGIAIQFEDPKKFIATVCKLMDGKKNLDELKNCLLEIFPHETKYLEELLLKLDSELLLEDVEKNFPITLTEYDLARWSKNIEFFGSYSKASENKFLFQEKLKASRVAIFGLGGVGSNVMYNLLAMGVFNIKAIDFDKVELSNLNRQLLYNESDISQLKCEAAKRRVSEFHSKANIEFINKKINNMEEINEILSDIDFVICAIDQPRDKIIDWFNLACVKRKIPFLCGSLDARVVSFYTVVPDKTGCVECWKHDNKYSLSFQSLIQNRDFVKAQSPNVAIMPMISLIAGLMAGEFLKIVTNIAYPQSLGKLCTYDFVTSHIVTSESWNKNPDCEVCSTH